MFTISNGHKAIYYICYKSLIMQRHSQIHFGATKRILRYLQDTREYCIWYKIMTNSRLVGYTGSD